MNKQTLLILALAGVGYYAWKKYQEVKTVTVSPINNAYLVPPATPGAFMNDPRLFLVTTKAAVAGVRG